MTDTKKQVEELVEDSVKVLLEFAEWYHQWKGVTTLGTNQWTLEKALKSRAQQILSHPKLAMVMEGELPHVVHKHKRGYTEFLEANGVEKRTRSYMLKWHRESVILLSEAIKELE